MSQVIKSLCQTAAIRISPVPNMEGYGEFFVRMSVSEEVACRAAQVLVCREGPFIHPENHSDSDGDGSLNVWSQVRGCAHDVAVGNIMEHPVDEFFITVRVTASRDGDDALDGTLPYPTELGAGDLADVAWVMRELLIRAAKT